MRTSTIAYRIRVGALLVLALGLAWAAWLFFSPDKGQPAGLGYEIIGGQSFAVNPADSKRYLYEVERMGGKFGVLELRQVLSRALYPDDSARPVADGLEILALER